MEEIWKDIRGFEGYYQISNHGRLKSFKKMTQGKIMSVKHSGGWYLTVVLMADNQRLTKRIHRLVAEAFIPNPDNLPEVNHKDLNKQNNHVLNLEWTTTAENNEHARNHNPDILRGMNQYNKYIRPEPIVQCNIHGMPMAIFPNSKEASDNTGVCQRNILQVANKDEYKPGMTRKQAGGYIWKLAKELVGGDRDKGIQIRLGW